jgi:undecaprenyl pyrophosphate phosphatase UppP
MGHTSAALRPATMVSLETKLSVVPGVNRSGQTISYIAPVLSSGLGIGQDDLASV